jgi:hypothetical protein
MIAAVEMPPAVNRGPPISSFGQMPWLVARFCVTAMNASQTHRDGLNMLRGSSRARRCPWVREGIGSHGAKKTSAKAAHKWIEFHSASETLAFGIFRASGCFRTADAIHWSADKRLKIR